MLAIFHYERGSLAEERVRLINAIDPHIFTLNFGKNGNIRLVKDKKTVSKTVSTKAMAKAKAKAKAKPKPEKKKVFDEDDLSEDDLSDPSFDDDMLEESES